MKAKVTKAFRGRRDGAAQVETIEVGQIIDGDLARVAVEEKWAKEFSEAKEAKIVDATNVLAAAKQKLADAKAGTGAAAADGKADAEKAEAAAQADVDKAQAALDKLVD